MPFDGIVASGIVWELSGLLAGSRIEKIYQTEADEIALECHAFKERYRLLISANPSNPRIHLTKHKKESPLTAPTFCMILRKHIQNGRICEITQNGCDRIINIKIDAYNEMGDIVSKTLIVEIMGKYSNIILIGPSGVIYDAIRHVDSRASSVRELLPARPYIAPPGQDKIDPCSSPDMSKLFASRRDNGALSLSSFLLASFSGFSPVLCRAVCDGADISPQTKMSELLPEDIERLGALLTELCEKIARNIYKPSILFNSDGKAIDYHCLEIILCEAQTYKTYSSINLTLDEFYASRDAFERLKQKKASINKNLSNALLRCRRKLQIYCDTLEECGDFEKQRIYGELITANMYRLEDGAEGFETENYYADPPEKINIPLDKNISLSKNAQAYFKRYRKQRSACENALKNKMEAQEELEYLGSVAVLLENCTENAEIQEIRRELEEQGYIKVSRQPISKGKKKALCESAPRRFTSSDGFEILVGKNNKQNDILTLKTANPSDIWLHVKNAPGSHVVLRASLKDGDISKTALEEAASLAAGHSSLSASLKAEVDFTRAKYVKKPSGARPGRVIYTNQKSISVKPLSALK